MMRRRESDRWAWGALALATLVTVCGACGAGGQGGEGMGDDRPVVPVVTSVVGDAASNGSPPRSPAPTTTTTEETTTTVRGFGESEEPIPVPPLPTAVRDPAAPEVEAAARAFLDRYWVSAARTYAEVADAIAPYATDRLLAVYRDPVRADQAVPGTGVGDLTVQATEITDNTAVVTASATMVDEPDKRVVYRTLDLVRGPDGAWRVEAIR